MIRLMKHGEEDEIRRLLAELSFEDQTLWRKQAKPLQEYVRESREIPVGEEVKGKSVILVAEEDGKIVALCWCSMIDRGIDKQAEIAEFYVEKEYRGKGIGKELLIAARQLFIREQVEVAFVWTHRGNDAAINLYKDVGFKEVDQVVMALVLTDEKTA